MKDTRSNNQRSKGNADKVPYNKINKDNSRKINNNRNEKSSGAHTVIQNNRQAKRINDSKSNISNNSYTVNQRKLNDSSKKDPNKIPQNSKLAKSVIRPEPLNSNPNEGNFIATFEKMEFDAKTIKSFMIYFDKNMNYTKRLAKDEVKVIMIYDKKIDELINIYTFTEKYLYFIISTFNKICDPFYHILSATYLKDVKPYFAYFKNLANIFENFSESLKSIGQSIKYSSREDETMNSELMNVEFDLNNSVEKLNLIYSDIFFIISSNLKENVLNKPLYTKVDTVEPKLLENLNKMKKLVSKLEHRRDKLIKKYKKDYEPMFCYYKDKKQKKSPELFNDLVCMKDFLFIEYELVGYCNKAYVKIKNFLKEIEILFNDSTNLFCDYLEALKTMIKIYYDENRFIIKPDILSENMISNLDKLIEQDIRKNLEKKLSIKNIIEFSKDPNLRNEMNHLLLNYRDILIQSRIIKDKKNIIDEITNFNLHNFKKTKSFFEFLQNLVPQLLKFNYRDFIQLKIGVKRDAGIFQKWRNTILTVTYQGHILLLDEDKAQPIPTKSNETEKKEENEKDNIKEKDKKNENENKINVAEEKISSGIAVKDELSEGILPNKLIYMYLKTSYGIFGTGKKDEKYLFQIWSYYVGDKKNKLLSVDATSQENLTQIINVLNDNNDMNLSKIPQ